VHTRFKATTPQIFQWPSIGSAPADPAAVIDDSESLIEPDKGEQLFRNQVAAPVFIQLKTSITEGPGHGLEETVFSLLGLLLTNQETVSEELLTN
jgi:hypothetical protein